MDELLEEYDPSAAVEITTRLYETLLRGLGDDVTSVMALAIFPLGYSSQIETRHPRIEALQDALDPEEPPSLYLASRRFQEFLRPREEYRIHLADHVVTPPSGVVRAVYQVLRNEEAVAKGWEFARSIHLEHYPPGLMISV